MWPAFAKAAGLAPDSVSFVNVGPTAKSAALKSRTVEIISDFYNSHDIKLKEFGGDLGLAELEGHRAQSYGNSLIVNGAFLEKNPKLVGGFRSHHAEGLCRLRRRFRALPEGAARPGHRARPRGAAAAMGPHQISDGRRIHDHQGTGLDRRRPDEEATTNWCRPISASRSRSRWKARSPASCSIPRSRWTRAR